MANIYGSEEERRMSLQSYMLMKKKTPSKNIVQSIKDALKGKKKKSSRMMVQAPYGWVGVPSDELMGTNGYDYFDYAEYPQFDYHQFGESNPTEYWPGNQEAQQTMIDLDEQAAAQVIQDFDFTDASADAGERAANAYADMMDAEDNRQRADEAPIYDQDVQQEDKIQPSVQSTPNYPGAIVPASMPISFPPNVTPEIPGKVRVAKTTAQAVQELFKSLKSRVPTKPIVSQGAVPDYDLEDRRTLGKHHHGGRGGGGWGYGPYYPYDYWMYAQPEVVYVEQVDDTTQQKGDIGKGGGGGGGGRRMSRLDPYYYPYDPYYYPPPEAVYVEEQGARWQEEFGEGYTDYRPTDPLSNEPAGVFDPMQDNQWYKIDDAAEWVEQEHGRRAAYQEWIVNELAKRGMTIEDLFKKPEDRTGNKPESSDDEQWWKPVGV